VTHDHDATPDEDDGREYLQQYRSPTPGPRFADRVLAELRARGLVGTGADEDPDQIELPRAWLDAYVAPSPGPQFVQRVAHALPAELTVRRPALLRWRLLADRRWQAAAMVLIVVSLVASLLVATLLRPDANRRPPSWARADHSPQLVFSAQWVAGGEGWLPLPGPLDSATFFENLQHFTGGEPAKRQ
jgi:hypothetical protein